ncbi:MAG: ATP-binding cassette domain-containing protein [Cryomorphaceae bacterium]|nr:ATP-binding cassette domain-containing protein [Cryomorphaceae bacterium]
MTIQNVLSTDRITKKYGQFTAVNNMSLSIPQGSVFGILGPNGSGKTTFLGMILGIIKPTSGDYSWFENGEKFPPGSIGGILEEPNLMPQLSAIDHMRMTANIKNANPSNCEDILKRVGLNHVAKKKAGAFSLGMKQRLAIGSALIGNPRVLVLDEPLNGLDPSGIREVRELILQLAAEGVTIIISSHLLDEIEKVCTHLAIFKQGNLIDTQVLNQTSETDTTSLQIKADDDKLLDLVNQWAMTKSAERVEDFIHVEIMKPGDAASLNAFLHSKNIHLNHLVPLKEGVEKLFIEKTK